MKSINFLFFILIAISCNSNKRIQLNKSGTKEDAINTVIYDYANTEFGKKNRVYKIREAKQSNDLYCFVVYEESMVYIQERDTVGGTSAYFPNRYKEINNKLYIWNDSSAVIGKEIIQKLHNYQIIDSTLYKINKGLLSIDNSPILVTDDSKEVVYYYICKNYISKYKKIKSNQLLPIKQYPKVDCCKTR